MIRLGDLLPEDVNLPKGEWIRLSSGDLAELKRNLFNLIQTAYKPIGGHVNIKSPSDVKWGDHKFWKAIDLDSDPEAESTVVGKIKRAGVKLTAVGHDNSSKGKKASIEHFKDLLRRPGYYAEVSGRLGEILLSIGAPVLDDEESVRRLFPDRKIEWIGNGWYKREIQGKMMKKIIVGIPKV